MQTRTYERIHLELCQSCHGVWLDHGEIATIVADKTHKFSLSEKSQAIKDKGKDRSHKPINCPKCKSTMIVNQYAFSTGVLIDRCPNDHGIWLDHGELERVQIVMEQEDHRHARAMKTDITDIHLVENKKCPVDKIALVEIDYESEHIDQCPKCLGVWCDSSELLDIIKTIEQPVAKHLQNVQRHVGNDLVSKEHELVADLHCIICDNLMTRSNYSYSSGVVVDTCKSGHGLWLDKHELEKIQAFAEHWKTQTSAITKRFGVLIDAAAHDAALSYDKAVRDGKAAALKHSIFVKASKALKRLLAS
jgi:Zn-finger nucleic acid-binding protein